MNNNIVVNDFMFCANHGSEVCYACFCDHRMTNNIRIEEELARAFPGKTEEELLDRPPVAVSLKDIVFSGELDRDGDERFMCKKHKTVDCNTCFDWKALATKHTKDMGKAMPTNTAREEKLEFLSSMGVELSPLTRLPDEAIDEKLHGAIDAAQHFCELFGSSEDPSIDPISLPLWPRTNPIQPTVFRGNVAEALQTPSPSNSETFRDLVNMLFCMGGYLDQAHRCFVLQDRAHRSAICLRVVEIRTVADRVPMLIVLCERATLGGVSYWTREVGVVPHITTPSLQEHDLLLSILNMNAARLQSSYRPAKKEAEGNFFLSFLLPISQISQKDIGRLIQHSGCFVCGEPTKSRCSQCLSIEYCSPACQRAHWKKHKPMCKTKGLAGRTFST
ncbi:hypothetical protein D9758_013096 [Tetrapyrgos nigripes]|uniref:MYND-type domain-containing protein n=1 Tax=Tetrapyrgos nigripes TaxID=182062 RepID=A0A8H5FIK1_9AGAR|nr:hypothetical protein D9758_013096 [Tetrapyrgos nigripes]